MRDCPRYGVQSNVRKVEPLPSPIRQLTSDEVVSHLAEGCFVDSSSGRVGIELEAFPSHCGLPAASVDHAAVRQVLADPLPLPSASRITFEPGGQLELSTLPADGITEACQALSRDLHVVHGALEDHDIELVAQGIDPTRIGARVVESARYRAMEAYFDSCGPEGRTMMRSTAALQINLDAGVGAEQATRWRRANQLVSVLTAMFANSPFSAGRPNGARSGRSLVWAGMDRSRTRPVSTGSDNPAEAWADYVLQARVMLVRSPDRADHVVPTCRPLTFAEWIEHGHELGYPTLDDLDFHLTTLFPPVRPRAWLELRMIDALDEPWWPVAVAVTTALVDDQQAACIAEEAAIPTVGLDHEAAVLGPAHPVIGEAVRRCFDAAVDAFGRLSVDDEIAAATDRFRERFVERGRCPADDLLDAYHRTGELAAPMRRQVGVR